MLEIERYKTAIFDCDGVILDSNELKTSAFRKALKGNSRELIEQFIDYHRKNGGVSRYKKFEYFFKEIKKEKKYIKYTEYALKKYSKICKENLISCDEIPGVRKFLEKLNTLNILCYVVSGGDQKEIIDIFNIRGLSVYFREIFGSPVSKYEHLETLSSKGLIKKPGLYFGDAKIDMKVALKYKLEFIFLACSSDWIEGKKICQENGCNVIFNFNKL